ncbi:MAG TPA: glycoside hydrolase family 52 protein [Opitutaceae bacterium]|nr:glycoside hydrolase family 52 protein [Opitutaceae bacterium]
MNESFHTQHSPFGAFASFTIGLVDAPGGFGQSLRGAARQNVYIGYRHGQAPWRLLPFFKPVASQMANYTGEGSLQSAGAKSTQTIRPEEYTRTLGWASNTWKTENFSFGLRTPFSRSENPTTLPEAEARALLAPLVCGFIAYDNTAGAEPVELVFGVNETDVQLRTLDDSTPPLLGFAGGRGYGFATPDSPDVSLRQGFSLFDENPKDSRGLHLLGTDGGLIFRVPAGQRREFPIVLAFYQAGLVTTGLEASYAYTRYFQNLDEVLRYGLSEHAKFTQIALERDAELERTRLSSDQKFLLAQATHSYLGSSQLLITPKDELIWNVNEGEYRMINTFDLTVDHLFFELDWHPWAVRNALDLFSSRYSYVDEVRTPEGQRAPGGVSFTHDMGVMNHFTRPGHSSYECDNLHGCFSHMTMEQLLNWILTAVTYAWRTEDWAWLRQNQDMLARCIQSMETRDHPDPARRDGLLKCDSSRCGSGSEITTYDSLDVSLGQARNNLYLAVKTLGAWILVGRAFEKLGDSATQAKAQRAIAQLCQTLIARFEEDTGFFPAVFEKGNRSRILPAVEGLVYPLYLGMTDAFAPLQPLLERLRRHLRGALQRGVCLDAKTGGWKMSSTSTNTWFSKIAIAQYVVRSLFPDTLNDDAKQGDRVHADWQRQPGCGAHAMCDQIRSDTGITCGSRYYPRGVSANLWLRE